MPSAGSGQADQPATATTGSQLFANAGHEVVSVVAGDDEDDDVSDDGRYSRQCRTTDPQHNSL